jgi:hypothetical protein
VIEVVVTRKTIKVPKEYCRPYESDLDPWFLGSMKGNNRELPNLKELRENNPCQCTTRTNSFGVPDGDRAS